MSKRRLVNGFTIQQALDSIIADALPTPDGCLVVHNRCHNGKGYPILIHNHKNRTVVRWLLISEGIDMTNKVTRHKCKNKACVNRLHIEAGSQLENVREDMYRDGAYTLSMLDVECIKAHILETKLTYHEIGVLFGVSEASISHIATGRMYHYGDAIVTRTKPHPRKNRRFTDDEVRTIRRMYTQGVGCAELARTFSVAPATLNDIIHNRSYRDVV